MSTNIEEITVKDLKGDEAEDTSRPSTQEGVDGDPLLELDLNIIIKVGKKEFHASSRVMCTYSSYIREHFERVVTLPKGLSMKTFLVVSSWMILEDKTQHNLFRSYNIVYLLQAAELLGIPELERQCRFFIDHPQITSERQAFLVYRDAKDLGYPNIAERVLPRIKAYFLFLVGLDEYLDLDVDDIVALLSSSKIRCHSEVEVFLAGVYWLLYDWMSRHVHAMTVMQCVRLSLIAPLHLIDIKYPKYKEFLPISEIPAMKDLLRDALWVSTILYGQGGGDNELNMINHIGIYRDVIPEQRHWFFEEKKYGADLFGEFLLTISTCHQVALEKQEFEEKLENRTHCYKER